MNYGLYLAAGGTLANLHKQDVLANNLANLNTVGYKPDEVDFRSRLPERLESGAIQADAQWLLEQLGGGQYPNPTRVNLQQGDLTNTGNDLDLAIQGDGFFVVHNGESSSTDQDTLRFTRDGRFTLNQGDELVMNATGMRVMDVNNLPIRLDRSAKVRIDSQGTVVQNGAPVTTLQVSTIADKSGLAKEGDSLMRFSDGNAKRQAATGIIRQGHIESSAVDPIMAMYAMINASKSVQANATMMQYHDNILGQVVNTFGRVG